MSAGNRNRAQRDPKEVHRLRTVFDAQVVCNWIRDRRRNILEVPMPGEAGYTFAAHIEAMQEAIEAEREHRIDKAAEHLGEGDDPEEMFATTMRLVCAMDPEVAEAYRATQRRRPRRRAGAGPELVYSRD